MQVKSGKITAVEVTAVGVTAVGLTAVRHDLKLRTMINIGSTIIL